MSDGGRMSWRTTVAEETWRMEEQRWHGNEQATTVSGGGATMALTTTTTKQQ